MTSTRSLARDIARAERAEKQPQPWPAGVVARYLTLAGATVDITETVSEERESTPPDSPELRRYYLSCKVIDLAYVAVCGGCKAEDTSEHEEILAEWGRARGKFFDHQADRYNSPQKWAQKHAETCRALPRPETT